MKTNQYNEPDVIFLQLHDPTDEGKTELADPKADGVTWCWELIHHNDVEYIRKDLYNELKNQITAYQLTIANMEAERDGTEGYKFQIIMNHILVTAPDGGQDVVYADEPLYKLLAVLSASKG